MRTYKHLYEKLITRENFKEAYKNAIKGKSGQKQVREFKKDAESNLEAVRQMVINGEFHTSEYREMTVYEPKERIIYKLPFSPDRIIHHAVMNVLKPILTNLMIENTYACIEGRGQMRASLKCSEYVRKYRYCLKCDIRKFYPSINQEILSRKLHRIIKDDRFMEVVDDIIFSFPGGKNCPIGNLCSQWFGNFYLSFLDNYVVHVLKPKGYERYCDDFLLFDDDKKHLNHCKDMIERFLKDELDLEFSKSDLFDTRQGVDFVGYRHFKKYVLVRKSTAKRLKRRMWKIGESPPSDMAELRHVEGQLASTHGLMKHACTYNLRRSLDFEGLRNRIRRMKREFYSSMPITA